MKLSIKDFILSLKMFTLIPIHISYGFPNGFLFQILGIDKLTWYCEKFLFGINCSFRYLYIEILFKNFKIYDLTD